MSRRAFTLVETLVVIFVLTVLSALLFPVFARAKAAGRRTICASRMRQAGGAILLYGADYDDRFVTALQNPGAGARDDRTWVQLALPYARSFRVFRCAEDREGPEWDASFDADLVPGDVEGRLYDASGRVETGYNFQNLSPVVRDGAGWTPQPRTMTGLVAESTLLFVESAWRVDAQGQPHDGGSALVEPPCRYVASVGGSRLDTFDAGAAEIFSLSGGWTGRKDNDGMPYGGAFGWHDGRAMAAMVDGSVRSLPLAELGRGCEVGERWSGLITDRSLYLWER